MSINSDKPATYVRSVSMISRSTQYRFAALSLTCVLFVSPTSSKMLWREETSPAVPLGVESEASPEVMMGLPNPLLSATDEAVCGTWRCRSGNSSSISRR